MRKSGKLTFVTAVLVTATRVVIRAVPEDVEARDKRGHDRFQRKAGVVA